MIGMNMSKSLLASPQKSRDYHLWAPHTLISYTARCSLLDTSNKLRSPGLCSFLTARMQRIQGILFSSVAILASSLSLKSILLRIM
jgi:hypothetical protein